MRFWEDLQPETSYQTESVILTEADVIEFASKFDPQPYHLDKEAAKDSIFGALCASGWQICSLTMRLIAETMAAEQIAFIGLEQILTLRWRQPVFPGDVLSASILLGTPKEAAIESSGLGACPAQVNLRKPDQEICLVFQGLLLFRKNDTASLHEPVSAGS